MGPLETESGAPAAEVSASFDGAIVEVRHLVDAAREELRIGGPHGFPLDDPRLPAAGLLVLRGDRGGFQVIVPPALVDGGSVTRDGRTLPIERAGCSPLALGVRVRFTLGRCTFEVTGCAPPSRFALAPRLDWRQLLLTGATALAMSLCLLVYLVVPHGSSHGEGAGVAPEVVARAHFFLPSEAGGGASPFGSGNRPSPIGRAFDARASRGDAVASVHSRRAQRIAQPRARATSAAPVSVEAARTQAAAAAQKAGILDALRDDQGSHLGSLFGRDDALGDDADRAMGSITSDIVGDLDSSGGGYGLIGSGSGGGGSGEGTIGLGRLGTAVEGGEAGDGAGSGAGALTGRRAHIPQVTIHQPEVGPEYDPAIIRRVVRAHLSEVRFCYEKALAARPELGGRVLAGFTISPSGRVVASTILSSTLADVAVRSCIAEAIGRWTFPAPRAGSILVRYPFVFTSAP